MVTIWNLMPTPSLASMNPTKDYYRILHIPSSASNEEIKKAFRKLAMKFHPDKYLGTDRQSNESFLDIQEAYQVLSDRKQRAAYHYARYLQDPGRSKTPVAESAEELYELSKKTAEKIAVMDPFRIDRDILFVELMEILADDHIRLLQEEKKEAVNLAIVQNLLSASTPLNLFMIEQLIGKMKLLGDTHAGIAKAIQRFQRENKQRYYWNRYKVIIALVIALLACVLMYLSVR